MCEKLLLLWYPIFSYFCINLNLNGNINVFCRFRLQSRKRKVGAIQGAILPNGKVPQPAETASATENNRPVAIYRSRIRVKMWGKSPRLRLVTTCAGKPNGLKDQIYRKVLPKGKTESCPLFSGG